MPSKAPSIDNFQFSFGANFNSKINNMEKYKNNNNKNTNNTNLNKKIILIIIIKIKIIMNK